MHAHPRHLRELAYLWSQCVIHLHSSEVFANILHNLENEL